MISEKIRQNAAAMIAFADGKPTQWRRAGMEEWTDTNGSLTWNCEMYEYRPEPPWNLGRKLPGFRELAPSEEWHRLDFSEDMLEGGWRPLLRGEIIQRGDSVKNGSLYPWFVDASSSVGYEAHSTHPDQLCRTRRPLPALKVTRDWCGPEDVPGPVCWIRANAAFNGAMIVGLTDDAVITCSESEVCEKSWSDLRGAQYSTDRKEWKACQVTEDAK